MTKIFHTRRFMAPVGRAFAFGACLTIAALAPTLSERLGLHADAKGAAGYVSPAITAQASSTRPAKIVDRINGSWSLTGHEAPPVMVPGAVQPERRPVEAFQIAGH